MLDPRVTGSYSDLAQIVREGLPGDGIVSHDNPVWVEFAKHMVPLTYPGATDLAEMVAGKDPVKVLDIAAGHGLFGILIAQRNPQAKITALDWPNVLAVARENAHKFGVADRHSTIEGDAFEVDFSGQYHLILVTNFFHNSIAKPANV
jgi:2-polyprenyl-3-methyl-5-hydroxy-6-metoxy-1,4-benzoquinol methylase